MQSSPRPALSYTYIGGWLEGCYAVGVGLRKLPTLLLSTNKEARLARVVLVLLTIEGVSGDLPLSIKLLSE